VSCVGVSTANSGMEDDIHEEMFHTENEGEELEFYDAVEWMGYFGLLPPELIPAVLIELDQQSFINAFLVCHTWHSLGTDGFHKKWCEKNFPTLKEQYKPASRNWRWVMSSKIPLPALDEGASEPEKFSGIGSKKYDYGTYEGEWMNGTRNGVGIFYWGHEDPYDAVYIGDWSKCKRTGKGICYWKAADKYEGDWFEDKATGKGVFTWASGSRFEGEWKDGKQHGKGTFQWKHGDRYDGDWVEGKQCGFGIFQWYTGNRYEGGWLNDGKHGKGVFTWSNGDKYDGNWVHNKKEGCGSFTWENKDCYDGEWMADKKTGQGKFTWASGDTYEGGWLKNKKNGTGVYTWTNGDAFEGEWIKGQQTGKGSNKWGNKNVFTGQWQNGEKVEGTFYEYPTRRTFAARANDCINLDYLDPSLKKCVQHKQCTYTITGEQCYFQYLWETRENVDRTHGVCLACKEHCVPANSIKLLDPKKHHFGGNFYCDCGSGNLPVACTLNPHRPHDKSKQEAKAEKIEPCVAEAVAPIETVGVQLEVTTDQTNQ